ncbi:ABC transporter, partial (plasmid) [Azospirillum argentinense]
MRIETHALSATAGGRAILAGVNLTIEPGSFTGLIGPNGAGKTTLLRLLAGLAEPAAGRVTFDGQTAAKAGRRALARGIAYLPQSGPVHWPLRAEALVLLGRLPHRGALGGITAA